MLDDGTAENTIGTESGSRLAWFNRFTPLATEFPLAIQTVEVFFAAESGLDVGSAYDVYVYSDPDSDPSNGADYVGGETGKLISALDRFNTTTLAGGLAIATPGDVLILIVDRSVNGGEAYAAAIDQTSAAGRSWLGYHGADDPDAPPVLPLDAMGRTDDYGLPGNWLVRATYSSRPVAGEGAPSAASYLTVEPNPLAGQGQVVFTSSTGGEVRVALVDALGREVAVLHDGPVAAGTTRLPVNAADLPAGVYIVRGMGAGTVFTQRITVVR